MEYSNINFNYKKILITGGAGFIGSNLAFYFQKNFPESSVVIFDCFRSEEILTNGNLASFGHFKNLYGFRGEIICGDLRNIEDLNLLSSYKFDFIFHHAAISDTRVYDQELVFRTNINSFYWLLNKAKEDNSCLVYASSAATYGSLVSPQTIGKERPENPYGYSKFSMDQIANKFSKENPDIRIVGLRFFNVYGPGEYFKGKTSSMIIQLSHQILSGKSPRLFNNSENIFRDFVYIEDVIQSNIKSCSAYKNGVFNVGTGVARSFVDIVQILSSELKIHTEIEYFDNPYIDYQMHTQADIQLTKEFLNYSPTFSLEKGIRAYMPYIKDTFNTSIN